MKFLARSLSLVLIISILTLTGCDKKGDSSDDSETFIGESGTVIGSVDIDEDGIADGAAIDVDGDGKPDGIDTDNDGKIDKDWKDDYILLSTVTPPKAPDAPTISASSAQLILTWTAVENATSYEVWYNTADDSAAAISGGAGVSATTLTLTGLTNNTTYYVWLKAANSAGTSAFSAVAAGTPAATEAEVILNKLGVTEVTSPPALETTSTIGTVVKPSSEWHPLRYEYSVFNPAAEVFMLGIGNGGKYNTFWQDGKDASAYKQAFPLTGDQAWAKNTAKTSCAADLDGDGIDEITVFFVPADAGSELKMCVYHNDVFSAPLQVANLTLPATSLLALGNSTFTTTELGNSTNRRYLYDHLDVCPADVDGDGKKELLLTVLDKLYILKISAAGDSSQLVGSNSFPEDITDVAAGDCNGDGKDEFVVCLATKGFALYDSSFEKPMTNPSITAVSSAQKAGEAVFGDFDRDNIDELCFVSCEMNTNTAYLYNIMNGLVEKKNSISNTGLPGGLIIYRAYPRAIEIDQDGKDELFFTNWIIKNPMTTAENVKDLHDTNNHFVSLRDVKVGDIDGDGKEEILHYGIAGDKYCIFANGYDSSNNWVEKKRYIDVNDATVPSDKITLNTINFVVGNFDNDSNRVKFEKHRLEFTNPIIIAALASPPYWSEVAAAEATYSYTNWTTSYGTSSGSGSSTGSSLGFSTGLKVEFEQEASFFGIKAAQFKTSASFTNTLDWSCDAETTVTKSVAYSCVGGEDRIIFTSVPVDTYTYTVIQSPQSADIGKVMTISLPRKFNIYSVDREFYNANNGSLKDIDYFKHTYGNPKSYHTKAEADALITKYSGYMSTSVSVAQYNPASTTGGFTEFSIEKESVTTKTFTVDNSVDLEIGGGAGGVSVLGTFGFHGGLSYATTVSEGTSFSGTVGNLPTAYFNNPHYTYSQGLFVIPLKLADKAGSPIVWVVDYWVE